jgi:hypothetical protein
MTIKKKIASLAIAFTALAASAIMVSATSIDWNVNLPRFGGNVTIINDVKSSTSSSAKNRIDFIGGDYDEMEVWMNVNGTKTYGKSSQYEGNGAYTMTMGGSKGSGTTVVVKGENASNTFVNVTARGYCNIY